MKKKYFFLFFFLFTLLLHAQNIKFDNTSHSTNKIKLSFNTKSYTYSAGSIIVNSNINITSRPDSSIKTQSDSLKTLPINTDTTQKTEKKELEKKELLDSTLYGKHGYLLNDDPAYNKKGPLWRPILATIVGNLTLCAFNRFILNSGFCRISFQTVKNNWDNGWEWDTDRFGVNFFQHPYSGATGFTHGRVEGYNFWESVPFAFGSSLMWEQTMENTRPSYNDLINTTITGAFLGEILYRLSSIFLDDRLTGSKRVVRELIAGILDPGRFTNRLLSGNLTRVVTKDIYQREPLQAVLSIGDRNMNNGTGFWNGKNSAEIALDFSYGDPLEVKSRKPFDYFKIRGGLSIGAGNKIVNNIMGYGIIFGKNVVTKKTGMLYGLFQNYDYWDNENDELGTLGFGAGIIHRVNIGEHSDITSHIHLGVVPLAGIKGPLADSVGERNYNYAGGLEAIIQGSFSIGGWANISASYYIYGLHTYVGTAGNYLVGIFKPKIAVKVFGDIYLGFEFLQYGKDAFLTDLPDFHIRNNEERIFIAISNGYFGIP
jgi:hypothetical protein